MDLPDYFAAINKDFHYQLTCVGGFAPIYIGKKIADSRFLIAGGTPGLEVSWTVTAQRSDRYVQRHGAPVEQDKPEQYRGTYLMPELYGKPKEMQENYRERPEQLRAARGAADAVQASKAVDGAADVASPSNPVGRQSAVRVEPNLPKDAGGGR